MAPSYISNMLTRYTPKRSLRFANKSLLVQPSKIRMATYGERAYSFAAPKLWNNLPEHIHNATTMRHSL